MSELPKKNKYMLKYLVHSLAKMCSLWEDLTMKVVTFTIKTFQSKHALLVSVTHPLIDQRDISAPISRTLEQCDMYLNSPNTYI